ncbi:aspartate:alanine exchanger family transporter [Propionibacterium australiense]|uniref:Predicted Permease Membrane Region n=1 Tax=Propionibacterium australiense TaxID=119981 RepID=A0A383S9R8_9ACTN|nr:TrkA C-terminal domain-containing protein [Propionibacterium australiense]RLP07188.1 transporter [Propionibacterium australiense]RLP07524.1 transporter [Propionibacterium australiense]SYZ34164.1 Predicted Permease Membrane Region [Propionibacterium australiense]VEH92537.1 putative transporter [Propionibacterium australiense]
MIAYLVAHPLLTIMGVLALGALLGQIRFGPLRFGAAGALFIGLLVGMIDPGLGDGLGLVRQLGVVLFCYTVGLSAGATFLSDLRRQWTLMVAGSAALILMAVAATAGGRAVGLSPAHVSGLFAGVLTSPAIDAAQQATGDDPGTLFAYAVSYPTGVVVAMVMIALVATRHWPGRRDNVSLAEAGIKAVSTKVTRDAAIEQIPGWPSRIRMSYLLRDGQMRVMSRRDELHRGDEVLVVGMPEDVNKAVGFLGYRTRHVLTENRRDVDFRRFVVSNPHLAGRALGDIDVREQCDGLVTRVRRGDLEMLATDDLVLQPGDRVLAVVPRGRLGDAQDFFGDSEARVSQVDALSLGLGIAVGLLAGAVSVPLPGGLRFSLGVAAGPLIAGMVFGALHRTGPFRWQLSHATNQVLRQFGLMVFLACVGLATGPAFRSDLLTWDCLKVVLVSAGSLALGGGGLLLAANRLGLSAQRAAGGFAGFVGQPAVLGYANSLVNDERVDSAYGALFALGTVVKILLVQVIALA